MGKIDSNFFNSIPIWFTELKPYQEFNYLGYRYMKLNSYQYILTEESKAEATKSLRMATEILLKNEKEKLETLEHDYDKGKMEIDDYQFNYDRFSKKVIEYEQTLGNISTRINSVFCFGR